MEDRILLGKYIVDYIADLKKEFIQSLNLDKDAVWIKYKCEAGNRIEDELKITIEYGENDHQLTLSTNTLSIVYLEKIIQVFEEMILKDLKTKENARREFKKLYNNIGGLYLLEFVNYLD